MSPSQEKREGRTTDPTWRRGLALGLGLLGKLGGAIAWLFDSVKTLALGLAGLLTVAIVVWMAQEVASERIVVERIDVPSELEERGIRPEVLSTWLVDEIKQVATPAAWRLRHERPVGDRWASIDFTIPNVGLTASAITRMLKGLWGGEDPRVSGEVARFGSGDSSAYRLRLRIDPTRKGAAPVDIPVGDIGDPQELRTKLREGAIAVLAELDPLAVATYRYVKMVEEPVRRPRSQEPGPPGATDGIDVSLSYRGQIIEALTECIARCRSASEKASALYLWGDLLGAMASIVPDGTLATDLRAEAIERYGDAIAAGNTTGDVYAHQAELLLALGREKDGWNAFEAGARENPRDPMILRGWGARLTARERHHEAIDRLEQAWNLEPADAWIVYELGVAQLRAGDLGPAIASFRRSTELDARHHCAYESWGQALLRVGPEHLDEATRVLARARTLRGDQLPCVWPAATG